MKKLFFRLLAFCAAVVAIAPALTATATVNYWYCKRNTEHKQPQCAPELKYIEEVGGIYVDREHGDGEAEKVIYLTFDVGYENENVGKIMDIMAEEGVRGSFFILGNVIDRAPALVMRMVEEGHVVANHTTSHRNLTGVGEDVLRCEIETLEKKYRDLTGREMSKFFRPPEGTFDRDMLERVKQMGYRTVFWSFAYADWDNKAQMSEEAAMKKILPNLHNGEIMLLHPTSATNAAIIGDLITELKAQGYRFATLEELK